MEGLIVYQGADINSYTLSNLKPVEARFRYTLSNLKPVEARFRSRLKGWEQPDNST